MVNRNQVVLEARKWVGTPFQDKGRLRGLGVDCVGLILCVMRDLRLNDWVDEFKVYSRQPVGRVAFDLCAERLIQKPIDKLWLGDVLCLRSPIAPVHFGFVSDVGIIHAYAAGKRREVKEHTLGKNWIDRIEGCFSIPGVSE